MGTLLLMSSSRERSFSALTLWNKGWRERIFAPGFMIVLPADSQGRLALPVRLQQIFFEVEGRKGLGVCPGLPRLVRRSQGFRQRLADQSCRGATVRAR